MIEVDEALSLVLSRSSVKAPRLTDVRAALGLNLAEDITSDIDSPPHDKALVDGYAVRSADISGDTTRLTVLEEVTAGMLPSKRVEASTATRIMTGAPIPSGADAVVMIEQTELLSQSDNETVVEIRQTTVRADQNIMKKATSLRVGEVVLKAGREIKPADVGLLSEVGSTEILAQPRPTVAVMATGNELVAADVAPAAGQIRNSNGPMLCALAARAGGEAMDLGIGRDNEDHLRQLIERGLREDVLVLSGGVSAGVLDLVPGVLAQLGVEQVFHMVNLKPGKPLWFGVLAADSRNTLVFGLPGNPVSSLVCFELFVRPAISVLAGRGANGMKQCTAQLQREHTQRGDRPTYWPSRLVEDCAQLCVEPLAWQGSADLRTLADANCLTYFPAGEQRFAAGEVVQVYLL